MELTKVSATRRFDVVATRPLGAVGAVASMVVVSVVAEFAVVVVVGGGVVTVGEVEVAAPNRAL
ncbi:MAG: hypothetical protein M3378_00480 [Actinomycetota bacterium]|nr:hypothetical protein [Actinomycetota bacterium]